MSIGLDDDLAGGALRLRDGRWSFEKSGKRESSGLSQLRDFDWPANPASANLAQTCPRVIPHVTCHVHLPSFLCFPPSSRRTTYHFHPFVFWPPVLADAGGTNKTRLHFCVNSFSPAHSETYRAALQIAAITPSHPVTQSPSHPQNNTGYYVLPLQRQIPREDASTVPRTPQAIRVPKQWISASIWKTETTWTKVHSRTPPTNQKPGYRSKT